MIDCLDGTVGVWCPTGPGSEPNPAPLFYLSDLPGINLLKASRIAGHETVTGSSLMRKSIDVSRRFMVRDFVQRLRRNQIMMETIASDRVGVHGDTFQTSAGNYIGLEFNAVTCADRYINGLVEYVELKVETAVSGVTLFTQVDDLSAQTQSVDLSEGVNYIRLDLPFERQAYVYIDGGAVSLSSGQIDGSYGYCGCNWNCGTYWDYGRACCDQCVRVTGVEATIAATPSWSPSTGYNGFVAAVSCVSDPAELICQFREPLAAALLYRSGAYLYEELLGSDRFNSYVRNSREHAKELLVKWMGGVDAQTGFDIEGEYPRLLEQVVQNAVVVLRNNDSRAFQPTTMILGEMMVPFSNLRNRRSYVGGKYNRVFMGRYRKLVKRNL